MLIHNALKRSPIADGLKKAIGQHKQGEGGLERWSETLQGVINPWGMPEWAALRLEQLAAVRTLQAAVAAEFSGLALANPARSGMLVVVEAVSVAAAVGMEVMLEVVADSVIAATYAITAFPSASRDRRFRAGVPQTRCFIRQGTDASNTFGSQLERQSALVPPASLYTSFTTALPVVLQPGDDLLVIGQTVNVSLNVNFGWRERQAFPGELA